MKKVLSILVAVLFITVGCKKEVKKEQASFKISGMTCAISCAKKIETDLSKKEGVITATINFADSLATVEYDANKTSKKDIMAFVESELDGKTYKTCNLGEGCDAKGTKSPKAKECDSVKKCDKKEADPCSDACKKACAEGDAKCTEKCDKKCQEKCKKASDSTKVEVKKAA